MRKRVLLGVFWESFENIFNKNQLHHSAESSLKCVYIIMRWCWCDRVSKHITDYLLPLFLSFSPEVWGDTAVGVFWWRGGIWGMDRNRLSLRFSSSGWTYGPYSPPFWIHQNHSSPGSGEVVCTEISLFFIYFAVWLMVKKAYGWDVFSSGYLQVSACQIWNLTIFLFNCIIIVLLLLLLLKLLLYSIIVILQ